MFVCLCACPHRLKLHTLGAHSYNWYGMNPQDLLIMKIPILRELDWYLVRYLGVKLLPGWPILAAQTIAESNNLSYFLATLIL